MQKRWLGALAAAGVAALVPALAAANPDAPHDASFDTGECSNCHTMYDASASGAKDHTRGCMACHNKIQHQNGPAGFPWYTDQQAVPGVSGDHHNWSGPARNPAHGATPPAAYAISNLLVDGNLQCVVCHEPHNAGRDFAPSSQTTSIPVAAAVGPTGGPASTGTMTLVTPGTTANAWRIQLQTVTGSGGTFVLTHNWGVAAPATPTWLNWSASTSTWVTGTAAGAGKPFANGVAVALDDTAVTVQFGAGSAVGNTWDFYVGYPFLRFSNVAAGACTMCHAARVLTTARGAGRDPLLPPNGVTLFSHPVNVPLNDNGKGYDRAAPLEPTGDTASDLNDSNNLVLDGGMVRCTTCHAIHNADSNSLSKDAR
jgi:hypothetical protein